MGNICEHMFDDNDPNNPDYSMTEYDLHAKLGMAIRKNHGSGCFEIFDIPTREMLYSGTLQQMVNTANALEGDENTHISCGSSCRRRNEGLRNKQTNHRGLQLQ